MKRMGIIGGMTWESSIEYYRILNEEVRDRLGGMHSADVVMYSYDFDDIVILQNEGRWDEADASLIKVAQQLEAAGAEVIAIATNTMHKCFPAMEKVIKTPMIHIADATGDAIKKLGLNRVALLGTRFTMEGDFYRGRLKEKFDIDVVIPSEQERQVVHNVIYNELTFGELKDFSRAQYVDIITRLQTEEGAQGVVLGCTEIPLLIYQKDSPIPIFNTSLIHAQALLNYALS